MSTYSTTRQDTDGQTSYIGTDADGCEHRWDHRDRAVVHTKPNGVRQRAALEALGHADLDAYIDAVGDRCGWADLAAGESLTDTVARAFDNAKLTRLCLTCDELLTTGAADAHLEHGHRVTLSPQVRYE